MGPVLVFLLMLPVSFFLAVTFAIGHARLVPYVSVWVDRLAFVLVLFGLPAAVALLARKCLRVKAGQPAEAPLRWQDVVAAVERSFPASQQRNVMAELERYRAEAREKERNRVCLAVVELSGGSLHEVSGQLDAAKRGYRDVLMRAEQKRDASGGQ